MNGRPPVSLPVVCGVCRPRVRSMTGERMGVLYGYSRAPDRGAALALSAHEDGLFEAVASASDVEALDLKGPDPIVRLGNLVGLLSGASYVDMLLSGIGDGVDTEVRPDLHSVQRVSDQVKTRSRGDMFGGHVVGEDRVHHGFHAVHHGGHPGHHRFLQVDLFRLVAE
jgi:hypothetical protein